MAKDYSQQLSLILMTLRNINDHLKAIEENSAKPQPEPNNTFKHVVVIKTPEKKKSGGAV